MKPNRNWTKSTEFLYILCPLICIASPTINIPHQSSMFLSITSHFLKIIYLLVLAALSFSWCTQTFSTCSKQGYSSLQYTGFSLWWLLVSKPGLSVCRLMICGTECLADPSQTRGQTCILCIDWWILNHRTTREVLHSLLMLYISCVLVYMQFKHGALQVALVVKNLPANEGDLRE